jgi:DNA-binding transcriptional LysR family regulator
MDRLETLRTFVAVAERSSFAEAARQLNMSPTTATRAIKDLEQALGVTLFMRTTRSVRLTDQGASYLERCRTAIADLDAAGEEVRGGAAEPRGTLVVTAPLLFGRMHILPIIDALLRAYPALDARLILVDRVVRMVEEGIDVAVRIADLSDSALHTVRVAEVRRVVIASPAYLSGRGEPRSVTDLHDHTLVAFDGLTSPPGEWRFANIGKPAIRVAPRLTVNSSDAAIAAAKAGLGITRALSYQVAAEIKAGTLSRLLVELEPPPVPVHLVFQGARRSSPNIRTFIEAAKTYFARGID